jgi:hypothetical protein
MASINIILRLKERTFGSMLKILLKYVLVYIREFV